MNNVNLDVTFDEQLATVISMMTFTPNIIFITNIHPTTTTRTSKTTK